MEAIKDLSQMDLGKVISRIAISARLLILRNINTNKTGVNDAKIRRLRPQKSYLNRLCKEKRGLSTKYPHQKRIGMAAALWRLLVCAMGTRLKGETARYFPDYSLSKFIRIMNKTFTIVDAEDYCFKQRAKISIGKFAAMAAPRRAKQLFLSPTNSPQGLRDKSIMAFLKHQARLGQHAEFFESLHQDFWRGQGGDVFAENCNHRFEQMFLAKQKSDFEQLVKICAIKPPQLIVELGCNSGLLLNYMVQKLPNIKSAIGIDINAQQIQRNREADHFDPRIHFLTADGVDWVTENAEPRTLFVTNGGVMEYFRRHRLNLMMDHISKHLSPSLFFAIEPNALDHDLENDVRSIPFGEELSFSHNYKDLFVTHGFDVVHQRASTFETWKMMATIAVSD